MKKGISYDMEKLWRIVSKNEKELSDIIIINKINKELKSPDNKPHYYKIFEEPFPTEIYRSIYKNLDLNNLPESPSYKITNVFSIILNEIGMDLTTYIKNIYDKKIYIDGIFMTHRKKILDFLENDNEFQLKLTNYIINYLATAFEINEDDRHYVPKIDPINNNTDILWSISVPHDTELLNHVLKNARKLINDIKLEKYFDCGNIISLIIFVELFSKIQYFYRNVMGNYFIFMEITHPKYVSKSAISDEIYRSLTNVKDENKCSLIQTHIQEIRAYEMNFRKFLEKKIPLYSEYYDFNFIEIVTENRKLRRRYELLDKLFEYEKNIDIGIDLKFIKPYQCDSEYEYKGKQLLDCELSEKKINEKFPTTSPNQHIIINILHAKHIKLLSQLSSLKKINH